MPTNFFSIYMYFSACLLFSGNLVNLHDFMPWGLAATFDLAAFRRDMIAPVKKSVNHSKIVTSMR